MAAIVWKEAESLDANGRIYTCLRGIITPPPIAERSIVMIASVCLCYLCLSAIISSEPHVRSSPSFLCMLPMAVALSSSGGVVIMLRISGFVDDVIFAHWLIGCSTSPLG